MDTSLPIKAGEQKNDCLKHFESLVKDLKQEYIEKEGSVTCEFSTNDKLLVEKLGILHDHSVNLDALRAFWIVFPCETCKSHNSDTPLHVMLQDGLSDQDFKTIGTIKSLHSQIKIQSEKLESLQTHCNNHISVAPDTLSEVVELAIKGHYSEEACGEMPNSIIELSMLTDSK